MSFAQDTLIRTMSQSPVMANENVVLADPLMPPHAGSPEPLWGPEPTTAVTLLDAPIDSVAAIPQPYSRPLPNWDLSSTGWTGDPYIAVDGSLNADPEQHVGALSDFALTESIYDHQIRYSSPVVMGSINSGGYVAETLRQQLVNNLHPQQQALDANYDAGLLVALGLDGSVSS